MADAAKPTVNSLATEVKQLLEGVQQAADSASTAVEITATLGRDVTALKNEQVKLAQLVNGLDRKPGDAVQPSKMDNVMARLESVERAGKQDWTPMFEQYRVELGRVGNTVTNLARELGEMQDRSGVQPGGPFEDLARDVEALKGADEATGKTFELLRTEFDKLREDHKLLPAAVDESVTRSNGNVLSRLGGTEDRLAALEYMLAEMPVVPGRAPAGHVHPAVGGVHDKVLQLMDEITFIAKERLAKGVGISYRFRGIDDAQNAVGAAMRKVRILLRPEVVSWEHSTTPVLVPDKEGASKTILWSTSKLTMRYVFVDPVDGSEFAIEMVGEGRDNSDKSASKAASMACKYALFQALMIPFEQVDESDGNHPVQENYLQYPAESNTPGARVNRGEATPAQAVREYAQAAKGGYDAAADGSAMAGQAAPGEDSLMQKAAQAAYYIQQVVRQPADVALGALRKTRDKVAKYGIGEYEVDGVTLDAMLNTALQNVNAALTARTGGAAQGVTRAGQQAGDGARARADEPAAGYVGSEAQYQAALTVLASNAADESAMDVALGIVADYEREQAQENFPNPGGTAAGEHDY